MHSIEFLDLIWYWRVSLFTAANQFIADAIEPMRRDDQQLTRIYLFHTFSFQFVKMPHAQRTPIFYAVNDDSRGKFAAKSVLRDNRNDCMSSYLRFKSISALFLSLPLMYCAPHPVNRRLTPYRFTYSRRAATWWLCAQGTRLLS